MAHAEAELEHVPGFGVAPGGQLVAPGRMELGPAQAVGLVGGEGGGDDAVGPGEAALGRLIGGALVGVAHGEDAAVALDHDVAGVGGGRGDEGNAAGVVGFGLGADPFGAGAGLAPASAGEDEPDEPVSVGGDLGGAGPGGPVPLQGLSRFRVQPGQHFLPQVRLRLQRFYARVRLLHPHPSSGLTFLRGRRVWSAGRRNARRSTRRR